MKRTRTILEQRKTDSVTDKSVFEAVCRDIAERLDADLVSIWFMCDSESCIESQCSFDVIKQSFSEGRRLYKTDYPHYFQSIVEENYISANDVYTHPATVELIENYFRPLGVYSLLDFILHKDYQPVGILCCENRRSPRKWSEKDQSYLRSISALISHRFC